jgi:hypothetical protein
LTFIVNLVLDEGDDITLTPFPEPTTLSLFALGAFLAGRKRRK